MANVDGDTTRSGSQPGAVIAMSNCYARVCFLIFRNLSELSFYEYGVHGIMNDLIKKTFSRFSEHECSTLAASLAYYTVFALPPLLYLLLIVVTMGLGAVYDGDDLHLRAESLLHSQASQLFGNDLAAEEIGRLLSNTRNQTGTWWRSALSFAGVLFGATGVMIALQTSLNRVWSVRPDPAASNVRYFVLKRLLSLGMILGLGFLLLVSLLVTTVLSSITTLIGSRLEIEGIIGEFINQTVSFGVIVLMFSALFRVMPDAVVAWHDATVGGLVTAILFTVGRLAMQLYLSIADPAAQLGSAAAALVVILVWVYYSSMIFLWGGEFTRSWAERRGRKVQAEPGAVHVVESVEKN
jgi:membrane protein